jgi:hypothetical protein
MAKRWETGMRYRADLTAGPLRIPESRRIADLLLQGTNEMGWKEALCDQNVLWWSDSTIDRLRSSVFQTLAQTGYVENTPTLSLQTVHMAPQVLDYLTDHHEHYVLRCIHGGHKRRVNRPPQPNVAETHLGRVPEW